MSPARLKARDLEMDQMHVHLGPPASKAHFLERFRGALEELAQEGFLESLARSMPRRCRDVIAKKGGPTKW